MHRTAESVETVETARARRTHVAGTRSIAPYAIVAMIAGLAAIVLGAIGLLRVDLGSGWTSDVVRVAGMDHTALAGAIWLGLGVVLLLAGAARSRSFVMALGVLMVAAGIVVVAEHRSLRHELAVGAEHGWVLVIAGAVLFLLAIVAPTVRRTSVVEVTDVDDVRDGTVLP